MTKVKLFQQKPKVEKFKPSPRLRAVDNTDLDRKEELEKFRRWLEGTAKQKSGLPKKKELDKLNNEVSKGRVNKFGLLGILGALPLVGPLLGIGAGALGGIATGAIGAISGGLMTAGGLAVGGGLKLFGLGAAALGGGAKLFGSVGKKIFGGGTKPGVTPKTPKVSPRPASSRPASSTPRSDAAGNQVSRGQQARTNSNRAAKPGQTPKGITQPSRPSARARLGSQMETGTAFGGKGSAAQKKLFKLQSKLKKMFSGKNLKGFISKLFGTKAGRSAIGNFLKKFIIRIPFIGSLINFALQVFVFKEHPGKAAFKVIGSAIGAGILSAMLSIVPGIGTAVGFIGGGYIGDKLGGWLYDKIFGAPDPSASAPDPTDETDITKMLFDKEEQQIDTPPGEPAAQSMKGVGGLTNIVPTANLEAIGVGSGDVGMTSGRGMRTHPLTGASKMHRGVDIGTNGKKGYFVAFKMSGVVQDVGTYDGYGKTVVITAGGKDFLFAHLAKTMVAKGARYNGQIIGEIGNTGAGTGEHLHFEVSPPGTGGYGQDEDPMPYVKYLVIGKLDPNAEETNVDTVKPGAEKLNAAEQIEEEKPKSFIEKLTDMLPESAKSAISGVIESFKIFGYMADKELMDSLIINPDGSVSKKAPEVPTDNLLQGSFGQDTYMDSIDFSKKDYSVEMLSPEAEALLNNSIIMMQGQPSVQMMNGGGGDGPIAIAPMAPAPPVIVLGGHQDTLGAVKLLQAHALS